MSRHHRRPSTTITHSASGRILGAATATTGLALLIRPHAVARFFSSHDRTPPNGIVQILGARQVLQGVTQIISPTPTLALLGASVDVLHLTSMLVAAAVWPAYRRPALSSAVITAVFSGAGLELVRRRRARR